MNISKWDKKVQIIPKIFLITFNTAHTTPLCTTDVRNKKTERLLPARTVLTYTRSVK